MAGIITNVDSDVQKLRKLKNEIEEVKKALKGINIKVDVDIAKGMEVQLKSLTDQYNALVTKVAEAEGKILLSTKRINDASEKIIKAQDKLSKVTGVTAQPVNQNAPSSNASETACIQLQAKAYDELRDEIDSVIGTRSQNIKRMIEESNAIRLINAEIKKITKSQGESSNLSSAQQKRLEQLNNSLLTHKTALAEVRQNLSNNVKMDNAAATSMNGLSQSLSRMRMTYRELTEEERKSPFGKELLASINQADAQIKELDATIGNHQRNVGNYGKQWNGLSMSIQQVGREFPSLAYGPKVFFSAISNNLPILADEIKRARIEFDLLKKSGQSATPVWKQIISSIFSWQTALTVGITLLTLYGDKVVDWVTSLIKAKNTIKEMLSAEHEMALARKNAVSNSIKERTELDLLYKKLRDTTLSTKERNAAVNEWMKKHPQHSNIMNGELISLGKLESAYQLLSKQIVETAKARAYSDKITELTKEREEAESRRLNSLNTLERSKAALAKNGSELQKTITKNAQKQYDAIAQEVEQYDKKIAQIQKKIKVDDLFPQPQEGTYDYWQQQVQIADTSLKQIKEEYLKVLKSGNKEKIKLIPDDVKNQYDKAIALKTRAEKALSVYDSSSKKEKEAEKQKKEQLKSSEDILSLRRQNQQDEINLMKEGSEKKLKQIELDYRKEIDAIKKQEKEWSDKQGGKLTGEQSVEISARYTHAENKKDKSIADLTKEELKAEQQALNDYLKEYGTFQQQKLAIAQEYAEKIKKAQEENGVNSPQVKLLVKERDVAIQNKETEAIKANIDWVTVFGEFGGMFNDMIKPALEESKKYVQTDKFKNSDQASQKALIDAINQMEKSLGGARGLNFKKLGKDVQTYQNSLRELNDAKIEEAEAIDKLIKAQENYEKVIKSGTEEEKKAAKEALDTAQQNADAASVNVQTQTNAANESQQNLTDTATKLKANMDNVVEGLSKLASGGISSAYQGLLQAGSAMKGAIGEVTKNLKDVPIIGWIVAIIDVFKDGLSNVVGGLLDAVFNAVSGILSDVLSGDLFVTIGESLVQGISKIFDAITFGGFSSWTNSGESDPHLKEDIEHLTTSNQDLKNAIDNLAEKMDNASVFDSIELYNQQKANLEQQMYNTQEMMRRSGEAYSNGFIGIGGSHSSNKKINDEMSSADWGRISRIVGTTVNSSGDFWRLTSEQMAMVSLEATDLYTKIKDAADDGYEDAAKYMDTYIGYYKELEELQNRYYEKLTSTSFDSVKDNFRNSLLEMKDNAEAFTEDFEEMMQNALLEIMMTDVYDKQLQRWYDNFAKRVESGGELTTSEIEASKREYIGIVEKAKTEWEKYQEMIGSSSSSQESTKKGFATASQDSIDELNGRFTALQIAGEEIKNQNILQTQSLTILSVKADSILSVNTDTRNIADEIRTIQVNSYLELQEIRENTGAIIKPIRDMAADIAEVKKNTSKL